MRKLIKGLGHQDILNYYPFDKAVIILGIVISFFAFYPSFTHIFRSDQWYIANFSFNNPINISTIKNVLSFELFGDKRAQPLAYLYLFFLHKLFGTNIVLYHIFSYILHIINSIMVFLILRKIGNNGFLSALGSVSFLLMFIHADTVIWPHFVYISSQMLLVLISLYTMFSLKEKVNAYRRYFWGLIILLPAGLFYEPMLLAVLILPLVYIIVGFKKIQKKFVVLSLVSGYYMLWGIFILTVFSPHRVLETLGFWRFIYAAKILILLLQNNLKELVSFPSIVYYKDIPYVILHRIDFISNLLFAIFVIYFFINVFLYIKRKVLKRLFIITLYIILCSYIFVIAFGRMSLYVVTQPRYMYVPDAFLIMIVVLLIMDVLRIINVKIVKGIILNWIIIFMVLNSYKINKFSRDVGDTLVPISTAVNNVRRLLSGQEYKQGEKIFISDFILPKDNKLFLGSHISLETMFYRERVFTRNIREAEYVLYPWGVIDRNKISGLDRGKDDFTVEFEYSISSIGDHPVYVINTSRVKLFFMKYNHNTFVVLRINTNKGWKDFSSIIFPYKTQFKDMSTHIVIQHEGDKLFFVQNGIIFAVYDVEGVEFSFYNGDWFIGSSVYFPPQTRRFYLENFYVCWGKVKYPNIRKNIKKYQPRLVPSFVTLNSSPIYFRRSFRNFNRDYLLSFYKVKYMK